MCVRARAARALYHVSGSLFSFCVCPSQPLKRITFSTRHVQTGAKWNDTRTRGNIFI